MLLCIFLVAIVPEQIRWGSADLFRVSCSDQMTHQALPNGSIWSELGLNWDLHQTSYCTRSFRSYYRCGINANIRDWQVGVQDDRALYGVLAVAWALGSSISASRHAPHSFLASYPSFWVMSNIRSTYGLPIKDIGSHLPVYNMHTIECNMISLKTNRCMIAICWLKLLNKTLAIARAIATYNLWVI